MRSFLIAVLVILILLMIGGLLSGLAIVGQVPAAAPAAQQEMVVPSPLSGLFAFSDMMSGGSTVKVGDHVKAGAVLGVVDNMPVRAMTSGMVMEIMVQDGQMVQVGQALFRIKTP